MVRKRAVQKRASLRMKEGKQNVTVMAFLRRQVDEILVVERLQQNRNYILSLPEQEDEMWAYETRQ